MESHLIIGRGTLLVPFYYLYNSLARLATYPESSVQVQEEILKKVAVNQEEMKQIVKLLSSQAAISIDLAKLYAEVRANESRLTQFLEAMPVGVIILNANGKPCYANLVSQQLFGESIVPSATTEQLSEVYQIYRAGTNQPYPKEQIPIWRALQGNCSLSGL